MRKKVILWCVALIVFGGIVIYCYPQSMKHILKNNNDLSIVCTTDSFVNGKVEVNSKAYSIPKESDCYGEIKDLCSKYTYHRYHKTLIPSNGYTYKERQLDYSFSIWIVENRKFRNVSLCGDGRIMIDNYLYKMDSTGNKKQTKFMKELKSILEEHPELLQKD